MVQDFVCEDLSWESYNLS